jgi:hypothetical protein
MKTNLGNFIVRVKDTRDSEISCSECLDLVSQFVNLEISGNNATELLPGLKQHLDQCLICYEEYQLIHQLAEMEAQEQLPTNEELKNKLLQ